MVPMLRPLSMMCAPGSGSPFSSTTVPVTRCDEACCSVGTEFKVGERANPIPVLVARMATINNTFFILRRKIRMNNKTRWGSACSLARITWPGSMGLISASQSCRTSEAPQVAVTVASSRYGKCQFAGAKIMPFCEISKSIDNYFSDLSINSYINIYYMYAREKLCA